MANFLEIATALTQRGVPVIPLRPRTKIAFLEGWQEKATTDSAQVAEWAKLYPDANVGAVAQAKSGGVWFWEIDAPEAIQRYQHETGQSRPATFQVRSRPGRGHFYFRQNAASIAMGNIAQPFVKHGDFSVRVDREYVVGAGSIHPISGEPYGLVSSADITEAPQALIDWLLAQRVEKPHSQVDDGETIIEGGRNNKLTSIGGKLRYTGLTHEEIRASLIRINAERCQPPLPLSEVETIARSVSGYAIGKDESVLIGGKLAGAAPVVKAPQYAPEQNNPQEELEAIPIPVVPYPKFPQWVMKDTYLYDHFVKPFCDKNSRYAEFMFMPAMAILLNYLNGRVRVQNHPLITSMYLVLIGRRGQVIKSSSVNSAIDFFRATGIADHAGKTQNAEGRALIWTAGSPEGFGRDMANTNCKNGILFYDELSTLANKASIDSSNLTSALLTMYEAGKFQNAIKSKRDSFSLEPNSYCVSLLACCTDKNFRQNWVRLSGASTGLNDRFFFLFQPEKLVPITPYYDVEIKDAVVGMRQVLEKAIAKGVYHVEDMKALEAITNDMGNRPMQRALKFALAFAVLRELDEIDIDCVERGIELVNYEKAVKTYLGIGSAEAITKEGGLQSEIMFCLRQHNGKMPERELQKQLNAHRYGMTMWSQAMRSLAVSNWIDIRGTGHKGDPRLVTLLDLPNEDD